MLKMLTDLKRSLQTRIKISFPARNHLPFPLDVSSVFKKLKLGLYGVVIPLKVSMYKFTK